jgi:hypothetical protein
LRMLVYDIPTDLVDDHLAMVRFKPSIVSSGLRLQLFECLVKST